MGQPVDKPTINDLRDNLEIRNLSKEKFDRFCTKDDQIM